MGLSPVAVTKTFRIKSLFTGLSAGCSLYVYMWVLWQRFSQSLLGYSSIQYLEYFEQHFSECRISLAFFVWKISFVATSDVCRYLFLNNQLFIFVITLHFYWEGRTCFCFSFYFLCFYCGEILFVLTDVLNLLPVFAVCSYPAQQFKQCLSLERRKPSAHLVNVCSKL